MTYFIERYSTKRPIFAHSRQELLNLLPEIEKSDVRDVRRLLRSGISETVLPCYRHHINRLCKP